MQINLGDTGKYKDAAGKIHDTAEVVAVSSDGRTANVTYTEGGLLYADCNVPVTGREEKLELPRFFQKGEKYDE